MIQLDEKKSKHVNIHLTKKYSISCMQTLVMTRFGTNPFLDPFAGNIFPRLGKRKFKGIHIYLDIASRRAIQHQVASLSRPVVPIIPNPSLFPTVDLTKEVELGQASNTVYLDCDSRIR